MTDNEKILQLLTEMRSDIANLKQGQDAQGQKIDAQGQKIDAQGQKIDAQGRKIDAQGRKIDAQGQQLNAQGQKIDAQGQKLDAQGQRIDAQGQKIDAQGQKIDAQGLILARMELTHGEKLTALFDGHSVNQDVLKRVEANVAEIRSDVSDLHVRLVHQEVTAAELRKAN